MIEHKEEPTTYQIETTRIIGQLRSKEAGPLMVLVAGVHGNEPAGIEALKSVFQLVEQEQLPFKGTVIALAGNLPAIEANKRYIKDDLNRLFLPEFLQQEVVAMANHTDLQEADTLAQLLGELASDYASSSTYLIDLHTTSAPTVPFIAINRDPVIEDFTMKFPLPVIKDTHQFIPGALFTYAESLGYRAMVFEAGQHDEPESVAKHEALVWLALEAVGVVDRAHTHHIKANYQLLAGLSDHPHKKFEIAYRYRIDPNEQFSMHPGFVNFQTVEAGEVLAENRDGVIIAPQDGRIFMPLYQSQGTDGFFIINRSA